VVNRSPHLGKLLDERRAVHESCIYTMTGACKSYGC
jgi:hypothetical protein